MYKNDLDLTADIIDARDIIARFEELESDLEAFHDDKETTLSFEYAIQDPANFKGAEDDLKEYNQLRVILAELKGGGGDEQWRGEWYPVTLIRDSYFQTYAQELAEDIDAVKADAQWPHTCIDWEHAARELQYDYSGVEINGATYWTR